MKAVWNKQK